MKIGGVVVVVVGAEGRWGGVLETWPACVPILCSNKHTLLKREDGICRVQK